MSLRIVEAEGGSEQQIWEDLGGVTDKNKWPNGCRIWEREGMDDSQVSDWRLEGEAG